ncbi:MAG: FAD-dependent oxidoreductase [Rhodospirillales bacterium]|nr:FAD-dependent oxidoreductase [Rhodospirillales bacterium]
MPSVEVVGSGVTGLTAAFVLAERGFSVRLITASQGPDRDCCSWWAGGMLSLECELEAAEPLIGTLGRESLAFWREHVDVILAGSLVVAPRRDQADLDRFARLTGGWTCVEGDRLAALEPDLGGRFRRGLFYESEGHLDPRRALHSLWEQLRAKGATLEPGRHLSGTDLQAAPKADWRIDCRGLAARDALPDLRGVKGEMLILRSKDIHLARPVRLLHPRFPLYIVPREEDLFMVGATTIETEDRSHIAARSLVELLSSAYALHPALGEAQVVEIGVDARPAFPDNLPRIRHAGRTLFINGSYRHGFLVSPALARRAAEWLLHGNCDPEVMDARR